MVLEKWITGHLNREKEKSEQFFAGVVLKHEQSGHSLWIRKLISWREVLLNCCQEWQNYLLIINSPNGLLCGLSEAAPWSMHLLYIYPFKVLKPRNKSMIIAHKSLAMDWIVNSV